MVMTKKIWILGILIILLPAAYYLISPVFNIIEIDETSPLDLKTNENDALKDMDSDTKIEFEKQVDEMKNKIMVMDEVMPNDPKLLSEGNFKPNAHEVKGSAKLIDTGSQKILRFEDFETINGPELHIYLSDDLGNEDFVDLGVIKATKGNVNYEIPDDIDIDKYNNVLVWCKPFGVLFSSASLS